MNRISYTTFNGASVMRVPYLGRRLALLSDREDLDPATVREILRALDVAADFYAEVTGRDPKTNRMHEGRITIAEVEGIGGAAWAWLGETGIEIQPAYLDVLHRGVRDGGVFDQPLFYELGRNWWFWTRSLDVDPGSVCTGYAVYMRFLAMDAAKVTGAPYQGWPFAEFRETCLSLIDVFVPKTELKWEALLATSPLPVHTFAGKGRNAITLSTADLLASLFDRLCRAHGGIEFMRRFLLAAERQPDAHDARAICENFLRAASDAAGRDLRGDFAAWRWPAPGVA